MPKLGEKLYNKLNNNLMNEPLLEDKDSEKKTQELKKSLEKLAEFFLAMRNASAVNEDNQNLLNAAHNFCNAMKKKVEKSPDNINDAQNTIISNNANKVKKSPDIINNNQNPIISNNARLEPYKNFDDELDDKEFADKLDDKAFDDKWDDKAFDKALDLLFSEDPKDPQKRKARQLNFRLDTINNLAQKNARQPDPQKPDPQKPDPQKPDHLTIEDIHNSNALYQKDTSGPLEVIHTLNNLIEGINGLQSYIEDNTAQKSHDAIPALDAKLKENVELAKKKVIEQKNKIASKIPAYLQHLDFAFSNSHRLLGNSTEYGDMLDSASILHTEWNEVNDEKRIEYAQAAKAAAVKYINCKKGNNKDKNWTPITKEGKKRFALAQFLRDTADDLLNKYLKNPDNKMLENDKTIIFENDISEINNSKKNENEDIISENNEKKKEDDIIEENDLRKKNENENDILEKNDDENENENEIISTRSTSPTEGRNDLIKKQAQKKLDAYSRDYYNIAIGENNPYNVLAKAVAVNVLKQMGIQDTSIHDPTQLFSNKQIRQVAATVKQTQWFKKNMNRLEKMVFKKENGVTMPMKQQDIIKLNYSIADLKSNLGAKKPRSAKITSTTPNLDKKSYGNKPNGKQL